MPVTLVRRGPGSEPLSEGNGSALASSLLLLLDGGSIHPLTLRPPPASPRKRFLCPWFWVFMITVFCALRTRLRTSFIQETLNPPWK